MNLLLRASGFQLSLVNGYPGRRLKEGEGEGGLFLQLPPLLGYLENAESPDKRSQLCLGSSLYTPHCLQALKLCLHLPLQASDE